MYRALSHLNPRSRVDEIFVQVECGDEIDVRVQGHLLVTSSLESTNFSRVPPAAHVRSFIEGTNARLRSAPIRSDGSLGMSLSNVVLRQ